MNQVTVSAVISRINTQQVQILFGKEGVGDDIVDQWGDRLIVGMKATIVCTERAAAGKTEDPPRRVNCGQRTEDGTATGLRSAPTDETAANYYWKTYACRNCQWINMLWFLKGNLAPESVTCEKCECDTT